jgi:hypothetical protein
MRKIETLRRLRDLQVTTLHLQRKGRIELSVEDEIIRLSPKKSVSVKRYVATAPTDPPARKPK